VTREKGGMHAAEVWNAQIPHRLTKKQRERWEQLRQLD
jgi:hypothetical protein